MISTLHYAGERERWVILRFHINSGKLKNFSGSATHLTEVLDLLPNEEGVFYCRQLMKDKLEWILEWDEAKYHEEYVERKNLRKTESESSWKGSL